MNNRFKVAIFWWVQFLKSPKARLMVKPSEQIHAIIHTDASLSGLGVMLKMAGEPALYYSARVPDDFKSAIPDSTNMIFVLEIYGAILGAMCLARAAGGRPLNAMFFVDNNAALVAMLRGHCDSDPIATRAIFGFWRVQSDSNCYVWLERVRSSWNEADAPSRGKPPRGATCSEMNFPCFTTPF